MNELRDQLIQIFHKGIQAFARGDVESLMQLLSDVSQLEADLKEIIAVLAPAEPADKKKK